MGNDRSKSTSIRDVAKLAGVSGMTVSRVVNHSQHVADTTRARVLAAIDDLGYRPNRLARALVGSAPLSVTVLTSDTSLYATAETLRGVEYAARRSGFTVSVSVLDPAEPNRESDVTALLPHTDAPVVVIAHDEATATAARLLHRVQPWATVAAGGEGLTQESDAGKWTHRVDERAAAAEATRFLLSLGHRTVHLLTTRPKGHRMLGWASALLDAGRAVPPAVGCDWTIPAAHQAAHALVTDPSVTAILCGSDDLAVGVLRAVREAGREVPGDLSIVGFDDCPFAAHFIPALTTVALDHRGIGRDAFELLRLLLEGVSAPGERTPKEPELIVRETTGPPGRPSTIPSAHE